MTLKQPLVRRSLLALLIASLFPADAVHAQLIPNPAAPPEQRAVLLRTANGLPQIDITAPTAGGV